MHFEWFSCTWLSKTGISWGSNYYYQDMFLKIFL